MDEAIERLKNDYDNVLDHTRTEVATLRVGRATPAIVERIKVEAYGNTMPIEQMASISIPDPKTILIQPWDKTLMEPLQKALSEANLGMQPVVREDRVLLALPQLTQERREEILRVLGKKVEEARVAIRQKRDKIRNAIITSEKNKEISEDKKFQLHKDLQKTVDDYMERIEKIEADKKKELGG